MSEGPVVEARGVSIGASVSWLLIVMLAVGYGIGGYGLIEPDEGRNAEVAREMAAADGYVLPRLNGLPYLDKPVLFFAAVASAIEVLGPTELAARLVPLLFGLATAALVGWFAFRLWGGEAAVVAATATATAPLALALSRIVIMDTMLSFLVVLALICFFLAVESLSAARSGPPSTRSWFVWTLVAWTAVGLGVLTKGPVAVAVPLLVAAPFAVHRRASLAVWHPLGPVVMLAIVLPWVWAVSREVPGFLHYVVVTETWARMTTDELRRGEPIWFFVPVLFGGTFPWSVLVLTKLRSARRRAPTADQVARFYLWLWLVVPFVFFSLSRGKQEQYVLPLLPAVALLVAGRWEEQQRRVRLAAALLGGIGLAFVIFGALGVPGFDTATVTTGTAVTTALAFGATALIGAVIAWFGVGARRPLALIGLTLPMIAFPIISGQVLEEVAADRSAAGLALEVEARMEPETELMWVESYSPGLSFYLERVIPVASSDGSELRSNFILRNAETFVDEEGPLQPLASAERAVFDCGRSRIFLLGTRSRDLGDAIVAAGVPLLTENRRWMAFGPNCNAVVVETDAVTVEGGAD